MKIVYVFRKKNPRFFSIERVFTTVMRAMEGADTEQVEMPEYGLSFSNVLVLRKFARSRKDVIFHITGDCTYLAMALPRSRTVITFHDSVFLHQQTGLKRLILGLLFIRLPIWWTKYITTISAESRRELVQFSGCSPERIQVIGNPLTGAIERTVKPFHAGEPEILFIGVTKNKNLYNTAKALSGLSCMVHIIGEPDAEQQRWLEQFAIPYTSHTGLTDAEMSAMYSRSDIVLFPSFYEGFGLPVLEGFQAGRIVITSDRDPMRTVASGAALLVDPEDPASIRQAVDLAISDEALRATLITRGFEVVARYQPGTIAMEYKKIYDRISSDAGLAT